MNPELASRPRRLLLATAVALLAAAALAADSGVAVMAAPGCASFRSQAAAQDYFAESGGGPRDRVGDLDADRDGAACEHLGGPYKPFATIGYNRRGNFFYGAATMPAAPQGEEQFPCLYGNRRGPQGPRRLNVYKVQPGDDKPIFGILGAEARPESGRLLWKADRDVVVPGLYYAAFEEAIPTSPYGANPCPGFRSHEIALPVRR